MRKGFYIAILLLLSGAAALWVGLQRPITVITSAGSHTVVTRTRDVGKVLAQAGYSLAADDAVSPALDESTGWQNPIYINRAARVRVVDLSQALDVTLTSRERIPANLLLQAGLPLYPGDQILLNGQLVPADKPLPYQPAFTLQIKPAHPLLVDVNDTAMKLTSNLPSLGQVLWAAGITLRSADQITHSLALPIDSLTSGVNILTANPLKVITAAGQINTLAAARTAGQALSQAEIPLQGLDYSLPAENQPVPASGRIQIVRVQEDMALTQTVIPYESDSVQDSSIEVGQVSVLEAGQFGLQVSRERIRYEDGLEVSRVLEDEWIAAEPQNELLGIGTKIVLKTLDTPSGILEYWRAITAVVTSYSPCRLGNDTCNNVTASGMTLQKGVVAVDCDWYNQLAGLQVYVPGYGKAVIADCGGGISSGFWLDLGFSDDNYESWGGSVMLYFLAPAPGYIPYVLQ